MTSDSERLILTRTSDETCFFCVCVCLLGTPTTALIFSVEAGFRNCDLRFNYTAGLFFLLFQRPEEGIHTLPVGTYSDDYFKRALGLILRWADSKPSYLVRYWKLMAGRRRGRTAAAHLSVSQWRVCCFGSAGCDGTERVSAAPGDRRLATSQEGMWLSSESLVGMWIGHNADPSDRETHKPRTQIGVQCRQIQPKWELGSRSDSL